MIQLPTTRCQLAENPLWHPERRRLYWTDITGGRVYSLDPATGKEQTLYEGPSVGGFTFQENGNLLFRVSDIAQLSESGNLTILRTFTDDGMERFNDVIADPQGRVFAGTIGQNPKCGLYRVDHDGTIAKLFSGTGCSNGMGFSPNLKTFYWTCTTTRRIYAFDYDAPSGALANRRIFYQATPDEGLPDGMKVDADGCIWSARWGGSCIKRHDQTGKIIQHIDVPAANVTSMAFGGENLDQLFISSAQEPGTNDQGGHLFQIPVSVRGRPEFKSNISIL